MGHTTYNLIQLVLVLLAHDVGGTRHHFQPGDRIDLWANTIGPLNNPSETYEYYTVHEKRAQRLGQVISGDRAVLSDFILPFKESFSHKKLCDMTFNEESAAAFTRAIRKQYYFEFLYDDLPIFGFVGTFNTHTVSYYLHTHWNFTILYNKDQVIYINLTTSERDSTEIPIPSSLPTQPTRFSMTYSVVWIRTKIDFPDRHELYRNNFGFPIRSEPRVHWISIANSFVFVLLLTGFLLMSVIRMLRRDNWLYTTTTEEEDDDYELHGWKFIHGDVFRFPPYTSLLCGFLGIGTQFLLVAIGTLILSLFGLFYPTNQGNIYAACIALYAVTSGFGGYVSAKRYKHFGGENWVWNIALVAFGLFALPFACSFAFLNGIALHFEVTTALPFMTVLEVICIWIFGVPLTVIGGMLGRRYAGYFNAPVRTKSTPRALPLLPWYRSYLPQMALAGFLPFTAIYVELFYIYNSVWGHHYYYAFYGMLCCVFVILLLVTACVNIALTYFLLSAEDYRWWWPSFLNGGSTGLYIYIFSIQYFIVQTRMTGTLQTAFYFTYLLVGCYFFFILLGTVGFFSSLAFVRVVYRQIGGFD